MFQGDFPLFQLTLLNFLIVTCFLSFFLSLREGQQKRKKTKSENIERKREREIDREKARYRKNERERKIDIV